MTSPPDTSPPTAPSTAMTLDELAQAGVQPGWRVLDAARAQGFTGELIFETQPSTYVYVDGGHVYHAVRAGDPTLCDRLVEAGVVEPAQIDRGVIRIGNVENLGRLFDRDPSIDRDAVMVVLELATDEVVTSIANIATTCFSMKAYRHHASGVHRWFVAPSDADRAQLVPIGQVAQLDASVTDELPDLPASLADDVHIEWDQPLDDDQGPMSAASSGRGLRSLADRRPSAPEPAPASPAAGPWAPAPTAPVPNAPALIAPSTSTTTLSTPMPPPPPSAAQVPPPPVGFPTGSVDPGGDADVADPAPFLAAGTVDVLPAAEVDTDTDTADEPRLTDSVDEPVTETPTAEMPAADTPAADTPAASDHDAADGFQIVWPDGSEQLLVDPDDVHGVTEPAVADGAASANSAPPQAAFALASSIDDAAPTPAAPRMPLIIPADEVVAPVTPVAPTAEPMRFELPTLATGENDQPDENQPDDVVEAVRRALAAIEAAAVAPTRLPSVALDDLPSFAPLAPLQFDLVEPWDDLPVAATPEPEPAEPAPAACALETPTDDADVSELESMLSPQPADPTPAPTPEPEPPTADAPAPAPTGFAAPTMADSAEAVYARAGLVMSAPASGVASVVFVDDDEDEEHAESEDRSGALKRLIGSLRRR